MNSDGEIRRLVIGELPREDEIELAEAELPALEGLNRKARRTYYAERRKGLAHTAAVKVAEERHCGRRA
jgi:hypothetical protein